MAISWTSKQFKLLNKKIISTQNQSSYLHSCRQTRSPGTGRLPAGFPEIQRKYVWVTIKSIVFIIIYYIATLYIIFGYVQRMLAQFGSGSKRSENVSHGYIITVILKNLVKIVLYTLMIGKNLPKKHF